MKRNTNTIAEKKAQFLTELTKCYGIKTIAARRAKIGRTALYDYINNDPEFAFKVSQIEESFVDYTESRLFDLINAGDRASIMFFLKAKAKARGYH